VQANGKSQESSSEAVNAYYACYLYGSATKNKDLEQFSHLLLEMEVQGARKYWHMPDDSVYDSFFASSKMAGNVGSFDVTARYVCMYVFNCLCDGLCFNDDIAMRRVCYMICCSFLFNVVY